MGNGPAIISGIPLIANGISNDASANLYAMMLAPSLSARDFSDSLDRSSRQDSVSITSAPPSLTLPYDPPDHELQDSRTLRHFQTRFFLRVESSFSLASNYHSCVV